MRNEMNPDKIDALIQAVQVAIRGGATETPADTVARAQAYYEFLTS